MFFPLGISAQTQSFTIYEYDAAGNLTTIRSALNEGPPDVTQLEPPYIYNDTTVVIEAIGTNLLSAIPSVSTAGIEILDYAVISAERIEMTVSADDSASAGPVDITFTTRRGKRCRAAGCSGSAYQSCPPFRIPSFSQRDNAFKTVTVLFDDSFATDQTYELRIQDTDLADITVQQIILPAGQTQISFDIQGLTSGNTALEISQFANNLASSIPVLVSDNQIPIGSHTTYAAVVGVSIYTEQETATSGQFISQPVGISLYREQTVNTSGPFLADPIGVASGPLVSSISPSFLFAFSAPTVLLTGQNLDLVTDVEFIPGDAISQTQPFTVSPDGTELTLFLDISFPVTTSERFISLVSATGESVDRENTIQIETFSP